MADGGHHQPSGESLDDQPVQDVTVDVAAHPAGAVPTRQQQPVDAVEGGLRQVRGC